MLHLTYLVVRRKVTKGSRMPKDTGNKVESHDVIWLLQETKKKSRR